MNTIKRLVSWHITHNALQYWCILALDCFASSSPATRLLPLARRQSPCPELLANRENTEPTVYPKIKVASVREYPYQQALQNEEDLYRLSKDFDDLAIVRKMKEIVPEFEPTNKKFS